MRQQTEQKPGITQLDAADYVHTVMQVTTDVTELVAFPIFTVAKLMSSLSENLKILAVEYMMRLIF